MHRTACWILHTVGDHLTVVSSTCNVGQWCRRLNQAINSQPVHVWIRVCAWVVCVWVREGERKRALHTWRLINSSSAPYFKSMWWSASNLVCVCETLQLHDEGKWVLVEICPLYTKSVLHANLGWQCFRVTVGPLNKQTRVDFEIHWFCGGCEMSGKVWKLGASTENTWLALKRQK